MCGDIEMNHVTAFMRQYQEHVEHTRYLLTLVSPISMPSLSNSTWMWGAPEGIFTTHLPNQIPDLTANGKSAWLPTPNPPCPE
jgi:hypothetical protein